MYKIKSAQKKKKEREMQNKALNMTKGSFFRENNVLVKATNGDCAQASQLNTA